MSSLHQKAFNAVSAIRHSLHADTSFSSFDLSFDAATLALLQKIKIASTRTYDNFGALPSFRTDIQRFLKELGNEVSLTRNVASIMHQLVQQSVAAFGAQTAWVTVRASLPTDYYDTPRWHKDGYFYAPFEGDQRKIVISLKGAPTLFNAMPPELHSAFTSLMRSFKEDTIENRKKIAEIVDNIHTTQAKPLQGSVFIVGSERAAIHSEPSIQEDRLFISVLPGTIAQITELRERWKKPLTTYHSTPALPPRRFRPG